MINQRAPGSASSTSTDSTTVSADAVAEPTPLAFKAALDSRRDVLAALPEERIYRRARLDVIEVCTTATSAAQRLQAYRAPLVALCGPVAGEIVDTLRPRAMAARQANTEFLKTTEATDLSPLHSEVMAAYKMLITDADSLVNRGHMPSVSLDGARDVQGYQPALSSLLVLVAVLREYWDSVTGITPITVADIDRAEAVAVRMTDAIAARNQGFVRAAAAELRVRALSDLIYGYDQLRRMMSYLRWSEGDADSIVPSLYAGRGRRNASDVDDTDEPGDTDDDADLPSPATPSPNNGGAPFTE